MRRSIIGIGSHNFGGQEVPQSAIYKLENQELYLSPSLKA